MVSKTKLESKDRKLTQAEVFAEVHRLDEEEKQKVPAKPAPPKKYPKVSKAGERKKQTAEGREKKKKYEELKKKVLSEEEKNFGSLYVFRDTSGWYKMVGNSAVIYAYDLAKRLKINVRVIDDTDFRYKARGGIVTFQNLKIFKERMAKLKIFPRFEQDNMIIFDLGRKYRPEELNEIKNYEAVLDSQANKLIMPDTILPEVKVQLQKLAKILLSNVRKMEPTSQKMVGLDLVKTMGMMYREYVLAMNGYKDPQEYVEWALKRLREIEADMMIILNLELFQRKQMMMVLEEIGKTRRKLIDAGNTLAKKQKKEAEALARGDIGAQIRARKKVQKETKK